jgi:CRISPR-associated protein Cas2
MKESMYYVTYDVSDDDTRSSVIQVLKDAGFTRIQKSVFCGKISPQQKKDIIEKIKMVINELDSFYMFVACQQCFGKVTIIGKGFDKEYVSDEKPADVL